MEILYGTPFPVIPGLEKGFKSSYGTMPAPCLFTNFGLAFLSSIIPSNSFNLPLNFSKAAFIIGSSAHACSIPSPIYSSSGEWFDSTLNTAITLVA